ncbi:MAG TPA: penicillin acylase family protein [Saprospiraceae bacterium]|nr:penicillin acylase family protein [Saprospiraceae bacterium]
MIHYLRFFLSLLTSLMLLLLFNGKLITVFPKLPPLGKVLNPVTGVWANGEKENQFKNKTLQFEGLENEVTIIYDQRMVPHIFALSIHDALFAQGYLEAKDRLFQLQFINRLASGRLAEILGHRVIELDKQQRRKGMNFAVENTEEGWLQHIDKYPEVLRFMEGINSYISSIKTKDLPVECKLTGMPIEEWTIQHSARVFKWMSDVLCGYAKDIENTNIRSLLDSSVYHALYPERPGNVDPVIPFGVSYAFENLIIDKGSGWPNFEKLYKTTPIPGSPKGTGSNNWAISPSLSATGSPIYCSDPHLSLTLPSVWYEVGIHTPQFNAYGVTIPGMPGIMMGFNDSIAWGETNVGWDVKDFFEIKWIDKKRLIYELDGNEAQAEIRIETIKVKGGPDIIDSIIYTYWGPISNQTEDGKDLAMRWLGHDIPGTPEYMTFINGMQSMNYSQFLENTSFFLTPAQNFAFASKNGDIALRVNGLFPAKTYRDGKYIKDGSNTQNDWQQFIPRDQNPQVINPPRGFVSSANQRSADETYPYYYNGRFEHYRNRTLNEALTLSGPFTIEDMKKLQFSSFSKKAEEALPTLIGILEKAELPHDQIKYLEELKMWDMNFNSQSNAASLFEITFKTLFKETFDEIYHFSDSLPVTFPEDWVLIDIMNNQPEHKIFDKMGTVNTETLKDLVIHSFTTTVDSLNRMSERNESIHWGAFRPLQIHHLIRIPAFSSLDMQVSGHGDALNAVGYNSHGPSWKMVVSLEDRTQAWGIFPGGQSGNPFSKFYRNSVEKWAKGEYHELKDIKKHEDIDALYTIKMTPQ